MSVNPHKYPRLARLGTQVHVEPESGIEAIYPMDLNRSHERPFGLSDSQRDVFDRLFGEQTGIVDRQGNCMIFPDDAEAVLERMFSGRLTGTQLISD